ncbi:MAG: carbohydrate ABC transporter permease, partial [Caldilineaceae bacterium]|nr:carbohydrate ABC transporter permease [Caldilineaceae bacterium]
MSVNESVQISSYAADNRAGMLANRWTPRLLFFILALFSFAMFYPFLWLIFSSFKTGADIVRIPVTLLPERWTLSAYQMVLDPERANLPIAYVNSILVTTGTVLTVLITSSMGGFVFARLDFPGRDYLFYFVLATTMVPFLTLLIPLYIVMRELNLLNSLWGVWVPGIFSSFGIFLCRQFVYGVPRELYDAAKIDGSGDFAIYRNIILPLTKPVLSALAIFTFLGSFNAYLWPLVVLNDEDKLTLPLVIARMANRFGGTDYQAVMAGSVLVSIPPLLVFLFFQRNFVRGIALTGL